VQLDTFALQANPDGSSACPAGKFCPYAGLGPSPSAAVIDAKREHMKVYMEELERKGAKKIHAKCA
jgi:hypothetical protein